MRSQNSTYPIEIAKNAIVTTIQSTSCMEPPGLVARSASNFSKARDLFDCIKLHYVAPAGLCRYWPDLHLGSSAQASRLTPESVEEINQEPASGNCNLCE